MSGGHVRGRRGRRCPNLGLLCSREQAGPVLVKVHQLQVSAFILSCTKLAHGVKALLGVSPPSADLDLGAL